MKRAVVKIIVTVPGALISYKEKMGGTYSRKVLIFNFGRYEGHSFEGRYY